MATWQSGRESALLDDIIAGRKTVEGRLNKGKFSEYKAGDIVELRRDARGEDGVLRDGEPNAAQVEVLAIRHYPTFIEMLEAEGFKQVIPSAETVDQAAEVYNRYYSPEDQAEFGVLAIEVMVLMKAFSKESNAEWQKTLPGKFASSCLAVVCDDEVLMVKAGYKIHWTFPGGIVDEGESPLEAALRETFEETGLVFEESECELLAAAYNAAGDNPRDRFSFGFTAKVSTKELNLSIPNDEILDARWVKFSEVAAMSGGRKTYQQFQDVLTGVVDRPSYSEFVD